jgi:hypothetical protein
VSDDKYQKNFKKRQLDKVPKSALRLNINHDDQNSVNKMKEKGHIRQK